MMVRRVRMGPREGLCRVLRAWSYFYRVTHFTFSQSFRGKIAAAQRSRDFIHPDAPTQPPETNTTSQTSHESHDRGRDKYYQIGRS